MPKVQKLGGAKKGQTFVPFPFFRLFIVMEQYKQITDYPAYEISEHGEIRNINTKRIIKPRLHVRGKYMIIGINKDKKKYTIPIHRLVALTYIDNPNNFEDVDHINRDRLNNHYTNLRWVSHEVNMNNRLYTKDLLYYCDITGKFTVQSIRDKRNYHYDTLGEAVNMFSTLLHPFSLP